jgi:hypothetical protein
LPAHRIAAWRLPTIDHANRAQALRQLYPQPARHQALKAGAVGLYTCGPTVYDYQHRQLPRLPVRRLVSYKVALVEHPPMGHLT